ncbi:Cytochrome P450 3A41 [Nymphon striatum]|nr:Cytochrome P450 3A41 [Nymphon striatum]
MHTKYITIYTTLNLVSICGRRSDGYLIKEDFIYYIGPTPAIVIGGLDDLRQIQVKDFQYFTDRPDFHLVSLKGKKWKQIRTLLTPTFSASKMKKMSGIMNTAIDQLMNKIKLKELTIDIIGRTAFGIETNVQNKKDDPFLMNAKGIFSISLTNPVLVLQKTIVSVFKKLGTLQIVQKSRNDLLQLMLDAEISTDESNSYAVDKLTATGDQEDESEVKGDNKGGKKQHMSDAEVRANAFLFLIAGYETTSTALAFTTHILLEHQEAQDKIKKEIDELIDHDVLPNYDTAHKLQYLDQVLSESLRIFPPVAMYVFIHFQFINCITIPKIWEDPEEFKPERFAPENKKHDTMAYQPFGVGPRNCIGMRFAQMQFKVAMARILRDYKLVPCEKTETGDLEILYKTVNMTPKNGIWLRAIPRLRD